MESPADFAMGDVKKDYCLYCARSDGSMQSYEEKVETMTQYVAESQGLDESSARKIAMEMMSNLPAWKNHSI
jgi:hypothetical protein